VKPKKVQSITSDLMGCFCILVCGLAAPFIPDELGSFACPLALLLIVAYISMRLQRRRLSEADKRDMKRNETDERSLMILERAAWLSSEMEQWLLIGLFALFGLALSRMDIAYTIYWVIIVRRFLFVAARWWVDREY